MTSKEWGNWFKDCSELYLGVANLIADLAAVEKERDEALRDVKQLHDAAVETEDNLDALKADCCATHEADNARCIKLEARVKVLAETLELIANHPHNAYYHEGCEGGQYGIGVVDGHRCASEIARAALAGKEDGDE